MTVPGPPSSLFFFFILAMFLVLTMSVTTGAHPVFRQVSSNATAASTAAGPTPKQLQECKVLGIEPQKCSEIEILRTRHICIGPCLPSSSEELTRAGVFSSFSDICRNRRRVRRRSHFRKEDKQQQQAGQAMKRQGRGGMRLHDDLQDVHEMMPEHDSLGEPFLIVRPAQPRCHAAGQDERWFL